MSRRDRIKDLYAETSVGEKLAMANSAAGRSERQLERMPAGPVRSMGLALDRIEDEKQALQDALATGSAVVDLDPEMIEPSIVRDRLEDPGAATFEKFKQSIADRGQEVPILVRPHPSREGYYQVAYGHRRLKAVSQLGRKVRAVVRTMSDVDLVVAQGVENSQREDLTYIERALFAARLEERGFDRRVIIDALGTDKGELSKLISVARAVPEEVIVAIGPAPRAGRRRWLALAALLQDARAKRSATLSTRDPALSGADTDTRFVRVLAAVSSTQRIKPKIMSWKSVTGRAAAKLTKNGGTMNVAFDISAEPEFGDFIAAQLDALYETFLSQAKAGG